MLNRGKFSETLSEYIDGEIGVGGITGYILYPDLRIRCAHAKTPTALFVEVVTLQAGFSVLRSAGNGQYRTLALRKVPTTWVVGSSEETL